MADPLTLALLALVAALLRGDREQAERIMGRLEAEGALTAGLEVGAEVAAPNLVWQQREVSATPAILLAPNPSERRRVVIWNTTAGTLRVAHNAGELQQGGGAPLTPGAILIDEPPFPHSGEWWAIAGGTATIPIAEQR